MIKNVFNKNKIFVLRFTNHYVLVRNIYKMDWTHTRSLILLCVFEKIVFWGQCRKTNASNLFEDYRPLHPTNVWKCVCKLRFQKPVLQKKNGNKMFFAAICYLGYTLTFRDGIQINTLLLENGIEYAYVCYLTSREGSYIVWLKG